ncbi:hypothetical protein KI387_033577 [Taxus chinensis]|uniref:Uncharacterized protein n=1 Tax=Taxus chinensis TaxID=29808 RepID=A0AA38BSZ1_TAXCH|nr:hypothetical protein KI387_033577 [Taxus chinensis]
MEEERSESVSSESQNGRHQDSKPPPTEADGRGKHRKLAELNRLNQEIRYLEEELEELDKTDKATSSCKEYVIHELHPNYDTDFQSSCLTSFSLQCEFIE